MQCPYCGNTIPDNTKFCTFCGARLAASNSTGSYQSPQYPPQPAQNPYGQPAPNPYGNPYGNPNPNPYAPYGAGYAQPKPSVGFGEAIKLYFSNYTNFSGRSRRSEYWYATLFNYLISLVFSLALPSISWVWALLTLLPSLALCVRRLHDVGKSGWWYLILLIPLVGYILLLVWFCTDSAPNNEWGPNPKFN